MNTQRDKFLTEQVLGGCWHETSKSNAPIEHVVFGSPTRCGKCGNRDLSTIFNPWNKSLSTPEGFFKLWNAAKEKDWWEFFLAAEKMDRNLDIPQIKDKRLYWFEDYINPDRFADALEAFLKERE